MPVEERTGEDFTREYSRARDELTDEERASRWLSHDVLHWGDYLGHSSDIQVANARDLPNVLGLGEDEHDDEYGEIIRIEHGGFGYTKHWVRISPAPDAGVGTWGENDEGDEQENDANRQRQWEAHVREVLGQLDQYPLFNDETSSEVMEEWASEAWDDWGEDDLRRTLENWSEDFASWAGGIYDDTDHSDDHEDWLLTWSNIGKHLPDVWGQQLYHAEGGEGGVYFDIDRIAVLFVAHHLPAYAKALADGKYGRNIEEPDPPENVIAEMIVWMGKADHRRHKAAEAWRAIIESAINQSWHDVHWKQWPSELDGLKRMTPSDDNLRIFADYIEDRAPDRGGQWPAILRAYAALPNATPDEQPAEGATT